MRGGRTGSATGRTAVLALVGALALASPSRAAGTSAPAERASALAAELRCPVCQNQNLTDSHSDLARDLRQEIVRQVEAGRSDEDIRRFMVERYGHYVLYDPPLVAHTLLLWSAPALLLAGAAFGAWRRFASAARPEDTR